MNSEKESLKILANHKGLEMYFSSKVAEMFAKLEQNEKNFRVAEIVDRLIMQETKDLSDSIYSADLGGGAHPDRYHQFFEKLLSEPRGHMDWVDISPYMLELAKKYISKDEYKNREEVISFIEKDILEYLGSLEDEKLDVAIMKYTIDHIEDLGELFRLLSLKLKVGGKLISTISTKNNELKSFSTNARYLYNGEEFPDDEIKYMKDGDRFTIKFFNVSGNKNSGYLNGAETVKYYQSPEKIQQLAQENGFDIYLGDWKGFVEKDELDMEEMDQEILVLTKK